MTVLRLVEDLERWAAPRRKGDLEERLTALERVLEDLMETLVDQEQGLLRLVQRADPDDPPDGEVWIWVSDGTEAGRDAGSIYAKSTEGATTKVGNLFPFPDL